MSESDFDELLAEMVAGCPAIWDKRTNDFKNKTKKEKAIKEIASTLNCSTLTVTTRFKALREKYRKEKIKLADKSGCGQLKHEPWHLFSTLSFLDAVQLSRKSARAIKLATVNVDTAEPSEDDDNFPFSPSTSSRTRTEVEDGVYIFLNEEPVQSECNGSQINEDDSDSTSFSSSTFNHKETGQKRPFMNLKKSMFSTPKKQKQEEPNVATVINRIETTNSMEQSSEDTHVDCFGAYVTKCLKRFPENICDDAIFEITDVLRRKINEMKK